MVRTKMSSSPDAPELKTIWPEPPPRGVGTEVGVPPAAVGAEVEVASGVNAGCEVAVAEGGEAGDGLSVSVGKGANVGGGVRRLRGATPMVQASVERAQTIIDAKRRRGAGAQGRKDDMREMAKGK